MNTSIRKFVSLLKKAGYDDSQRSGASMTLFLINKIS
jgi:hypothetical protein